NQASKRPGTAANSPGRGTPIQEIDVQQDFISDELFYAWAAGFIDGEGHLGIARRRRRNGSGTWHYFPILTLSNTVRAPLDEFKARRGIGSVHCRGKVPGYKPVYCYVIAAQACLRLLPRVRPYLRVKGPQADVLLRFQSRPGTGTPGAPAVDDAA